MTDEDDNRRHQDDRRQEEERRFDARTANKAEKAAQQAFLKKFETDSDSRLYKYSAISLIIALACGFLFKTIEFVYDEFIVEVKEDVIATADFKKKEEKKKEKKKKKKKKVQKNRGGGGKAKGKKTKKNINGVGILKTLTSKTKSSAHSAYNLMNNKFANVEKSLNNIASLKNTGKSSFSGRKGKKSGGFNEGFVGEGSGGIDGMLGNLLGGSDMRVAGRAKGKLREPSASEIDMGQGGSRRSASSILKVVRRHMPGLRHTYNKYLKKHPGFSGKINMRFEIAPSGKVVRATVSRSTTGIPAFDAEVKKKVRRWRFDPITGKGNDIVTIPFTFSE